MSSTENPVQPTRLGRHLVQSLIWTAPLLGLMGLWLWLAFSSGGNLPRHWLVYGLGLGFFGLLTAALITYPRQPRQLSLAVLGLCACCSLWTAASALWAESGNQVWLESARSFVYLLAFALAAAFLTHPQARRAFRHLIILSAFVLVAGTVVRLWTAGDPGSCFVGNRLSCPTGIPDGSAGLFLLLFWPLMWLAAGPEEKAPLRGTALGLATGLLALALMTQSLIGLAGLLLSAFFAFLVSPARLRMLFYLLAPGLLMLYEFPTFRRYWTQGAETIGGGLAGRSLLTAAVVAAFIGMVLALLERWVRVSRRMKFIFGVVVLLGLLAGVVYGSVQASQNPDGPVDWVAQLWENVTGQADQQSTAPVYPQLALPGLNDRADIWTVAWREFLRSPVTGLGADGFTFSYDRLRTSETLTVQDPHSLELQVLAETGAVGAAFLLGAGLLALAGILWPRCQAGLRREHTLHYGWEMALLAGAVYWFIHASLDSLWATGGVTVGSIFLVAAALAEADAHKDPMWPRVRRLCIPVAQAFRVFTMTAAAAVLVLTGLPYASFVYQESALASPDVQLGVQQAQRAHWLMPTASEPYLILGAIYEKAAVRSTQAGAVLDNLALALASYQKAIDLEPAYWLPCFRAATAATNLLVAGSLAQGNLSPSTLRRLQEDLPEISDWSYLADLTQPPAAPGEAPDSLARTATTRAQAAYYRAVEPSDLAELATIMFQAAKRCNPLEPRIHTALAALERLRAQIH